MWSLDNSDDDICSCGRSYLLSAWQQLWRISEQVICYYIEIYNWSEHVHCAFLNRIGAFFFIIINVVFGNLSAVELFIKERPVFMYVFVPCNSSYIFMVPCSHQSAAGYYRVSSYFFAKMLCDLLPMRFLPVIFFSAISYWMIGELWILSYL